jgi:hypothetical protein
MEETMMPLLPLVEVLCLPIEQRRQPIWYDNVEVLKPIHCDGWNAFNVIPVGERLRVNDATAADWIASGQAKAIHAPVYVTREEMEQLPSPNTSRQQE